MGPMGDIDRYFCVPLMKAYVWIWRRSQANHNFHWHFCEVHHRFNSSEWCFVDGTVRAIGINCEAWMAFQAFQLFATYVRASAFTSTRCKRIVSLITIFKKEKKNSFFNGTDHSRQKEHISFNGHRFARRQNIALEKHLHIAIKLQMHKIII